MAKARLGNTYEALSGRLGNTVTSNDQDGTSVRSYNPISKQPFTPSQLAAETAFTKAAQTWLTLPEATVADFETYAKGQKVRNPLTGKYRTRRGRQVFIGLYAKLLQLSPTHALPQVPTETYVGSGTSLRLEFSAGSVDWTASAADPAGTTTELMAQRLPSAVALPTPDGYRTLAFHAFASGSLSFSTALAPGYWAFAAQSVETTTGRVAGFRPLTTAKITLALVQGGANEASEGLKKAA